MSASSLGKAAEKRVRDILAAEGYELIQVHLSRTAVDVWAMKPGQTLAVQVKRSKSGSPRVAEWNELWRLAQNAGAVPVVAFSPSTARTEFWQVTAPKGGSNRRQPMTPFSLDFAASGVEG